MSDPALVLRAVRKRFGQVRAVDDVDLEVAGHELVALVGPSGCGKSTLLRMAAGLLPIDGGTIGIGGVVVDDGVRRIEPERRRIGLVFQEHALFPHLTVAANITFGLRALSRAERGARAERWLDVIGLAGSGARYPHELSGGERQRVALARALAPEPRLVLLDEPFASLDPNLRARLRSEVVTTLRDTGTPALIVTHDQAEALTVGDRVAVMRSGRIEQDDAPDSVYHRPANRFVAGFMGEATFLPVAAGRTELGAADAPDGTLLVVRPHDLAVTLDSRGVGTAGSSPLAVPATVVAVEFHGSTRSYVLRLPSGTTVLAAAPHTTRADVGACVGVTLGPGPHASVPA